MKRFDRYILKKYFVTFFFAAFLFTLIAVVLDISQKIETLIEVGVNATTVVTNYYLPFIPWINGILWPLFALISVIFFTSRLAKNSEIIAMLSAGVSFRRLTLPYLLASGLLALVHFAGNHYFIPLGNKTYIAFENTYISPGNKKTKTDHIHIYLNPQSKIYIRHYRTSDTSMRDVFLEEYSDDQLVKLIKAKEMKWVGEPSTWRLSNYEVREFHGERESYIDAEGQSFDTTLNLLPEDFVRYSNQRDIMTTREMRDFIDYENSKGLGTAKPMVTEIHRRTADPYTVIVLTIIGMAVAARKVRGGMGVHLALGVLIGALYILMSKFAITFAAQLDLPAGFSVWIPNILFTLVAIFLVFRAQK